MRKTHQTDEHADVVATLMNISNVLIKQKKIEEALYYSNQSLVIKRKLIETDDVYGHNKK